LQQLTVFHCAPHPRLEPGIHPVAPLIIILQPIALFADTVEKAKVQKKQTKLNDDLWNFELQFFSLPAFFHFSVSASQRFR
jgi:hypothetical protein